MLCRSSDKDRKPDQRTVNCKECIYGSDKVSPRFNNFRGRSCFKFSSPEVREKLIKHETHNGKTEDSLVAAYNSIREFQSENSGSHDFEKVMRALNMCPWSWPFSKQEEQACWLVSKCSSDFGLTLPYPSIPIDEQPNLFYEFSSLFNSAKMDYTGRQKDGNRSS